jgi:hypothetical protein
LRFKPVFSAVARIQALKTGFYLSVAAVESVDTLISTHLRWFELYACRPTLEVKQIYLVGYQTNDGLRFQATPVGLTLSLGFPG